MTGYAGTNIGRRKSPCGFLFSFIRVDNMRNLLLHTLLVILLSLPGYSLYAQTPTTQIEAQIRAFHLDGALKTSQSISDPAQRTYYQAKILFLKVIATDDDAFMPAFLTIIKAAQNEASKLSDKNPLRGVYLAELSFMRGAVRAMDNSILKATLDLKSACDYLDANQQRFPNNIEQKKLLGVFHIALGAIPRKFQWLSGIFCFRGDMETGVKLLEEASRQSTLLPDEAEVVLFFLEKNLLSRPESALKRAESLTKRFPTSFPYNYLQVSALLEMRKTDRALEIVATREASFRNDSELLFSPFWDYTRAKMHYFKLELPEAERYFTLFLSKAKGKTFLSDATFRKGMCQALQGKTTEAQKVFQTMVDRQSSGFDEDEYGLSMAKLFLSRVPTQTELTLFRARNLFDGGYYTQASKQLAGLMDNKDNLNADDRTELYYRFGRIFQESGKQEIAETFYGSSMLENPGRNLWMKVYSIYYLGKIQLEKGHKSDAEKLFNYALTFDDYFYQSGLEQKCKAGLHQLKTTP